MARKDYQVGKSTVLSQSRRYISGPSPTPARHLDQSTAISSTEYVYLPI